MPLLEVVGIAAPAKALAPRPRPGLAGMSPQPPAVISERSFVRLGLVLGLVAGVAAAAWAARGVYDRLEALEKGYTALQAVCSSSRQVTDQIIASAIRKLQSDDFTADGRPRVDAVRRVLTAAGVELRPSRLQIDRVWSTFPRRARPLVKG